MEDFSLPECAEAVNDELGAAVVLGSPAADFEPALSDVPAPDSLLLLKPGSIEAGMTEGVLLDWIFERVLPLIPAGDVTSFEADTWLPVSPPELPIEFCGVGTGVCKADSGEVIDREKLKLIEAAIVGDVSTVAPDVRVAAARLRDASVVEEAGTLDMGESVVEAEAPPATAEVVSPQRPATVEGMSSTMIVIVHILSLMRSPTRETGPLGAFTILPRPLLTA